MVPPGQAVQATFYDTAITQQMNAASQCNPFSRDMLSDGDGVLAGGSINVMKDRRVSRIGFWPC
jgi:hypothetical protein